MKSTIFNLIILDESGSMGPITQQTISGCNETINTIKAAQEKYTDTQEHFVSIYAFQSGGSSPSRYLIKNAPAAQAEHITEKDYQPCGWTPLLDAVGSTLTDLKAKVAKCEDAIGSVTIITDGEENSSTDYSAEQVVKMIDALKEQGWNFNFIGSGIDVNRISARMHIDNSMCFDMSVEGSSAMYAKERRSRDRWFNKMDILNKQGITKEELIRRRKEEAMKFFEEDEEPETERVAPSQINDLAPNEIFVFGSNLHGLHGGGAARVARKKFGAIMGQGVGLQGRSYAIPTMQGGVETIKPYVDEFIEFAKNHPEYKFLVTRIGCGIAGFCDDEIAPLFREALNVNNIYLPQSFIDVLKKGKNN